MKSGKKAGIFQDVWKTAGLNSRTDKKKVTLREMIFGYFLGPLLVLSMTSVVASYYLTFYRTYEDVVNQRVFLTVLLLISADPYGIVKHCNRNHGWKDQDEAGKSKTLHITGSANAVDFRNPGILHSLFQSGCAWSGWW